MNELIHRHLDGVLSSAEEAELNNWLRADPVNAREFAAIAMLHDRLRHVVRGLPPAGDAPLPAASVDGPRRRWKWAGALGGVAALFALAAGLFWLTSGAELNAATELERLIASQPQAGDRVYRITSLDPDPRPPEPKQPPIDGALLYVRPPDRYVMLRRFPDGRPYATGYDGERNWAAPPEGAVRLSRDPWRFRWELPGHQHGIPFADLRGDLAQLRDAYDLRLLPADSNGWRGLEAVKKSRDFRGPRRVELWYEPASGVIHRMVFDGLPQARGGPKGVAVELMERRDLGPDFFNHESHHKPGRRVIEED